MKRTQKAYKNLGFLTGPAARTMRILSEYEEPRQRFRDERVRDTIVFYGSARARTPEEAQATVDDLEAQLTAAQAANDAEAATAVEHELERMRPRVTLARYYDEARELGKRLTEWSINSKGRSYYVCTGGGPGIMEAGNRGASEVPGGRSVGLGISLPFEEDVNQYVPDDLAFEFHYFFMRKYWFMYLAKAVVLFPGGFGTLDEMFETLTLRQTGKIKKPMPTVLYGREYWEGVLNFDTMVRFGTISAGDVDLFHVSDTVEDAFEYLTNQLAEHDGRG